MRIKSVIIVAVFMLMSFSVVADENKPAELKALSSWTNQSGSTLYIDSIGANGLLTGTFINRAAGYACQNIPFPVTGWVYGSAITFETIWQSTSESCNSITTWTGFLNQGQIHTLWQLVINGSTSTSQIIKGSDIFSPSASVVNKSLIINH